jgi:hypothetical protein
MDTVTRSTGEIAAAKLRRSAADAGIGHDDPLQPLVDALAETVTMLHEQRQPIPEIALHNAIVQGVGVYAQGLIGALNLRTALTAGGVALVLMIAAFGGGYWWHGSQQLIAGVSAGQQECHEQHGGTVCLIPIWTKLPPQ